VYARTHIDACSSAEVERRQLQDELDTNKSIALEVSTAWSQQKRATLLVYEECGVAPPVIALAENKKPPKPKAPVPTLPTSQSEFAAQLLRMDASRRQLVERKEKWDHSCLEFPVHLRVLKASLKNLKEPVCGTYTRTRTRGVPLFTESPAAVERQGIEREIESITSVHRRILSEYRAQKRSTVLVYKECGETPPDIALPAKKQQKRPKAPAVSADQPPAVSADQHSVIDAATQATLDASLKDLDMLSAQWGVACAAGKALKARLEESTSGRQTRARIHSLLRPISLIVLQLWSDTTLYKIVPRTSIGANA
jgi:hypothetical protein